MKDRGCKYFHPENGMKVLVVEDFSIPNANMYLFYKVGSPSRVSRYYWSFSFFFEHMMFNGAKKYGPNNLTKQWNSMEVIMPIPLKMLPYTVGFLPQLLLLYLISKRIAFESLVLI
jgi:predicted Zn-dependent peptidase